jgi:DNA-binding protein HU-beta
MTRTTIVDKIASEAGISKTKADKAFRAMTEAITHSLRRGQKVTLVGFGTFETRKRKARTGRNPKTGDAIRIPSIKVPRFRAGKNLKDAVR